MTSGTRSTAKTDRRTGCAGASAPALYVNYFEVGHNPFEFLIDCGQYHPGSVEGEGQVTMHTCVVIAPPFAKVLSELLVRAVEEHESEHGAIAPIGLQTNPFEITLSSLGDFEDRARALRARHGDGALAASGSGRTPAGDPVKRIRSRKGR